MSEPPQPKKLKNTSSRALAYLEVGCHYIEREYLPSVSFHHFLIWRKAKTADHGHPR